MTSPCISHAAATAPQAAPQAVVQSAGQAAIFIIVSMAPDADAPGRVRAALADLPALLRSLNLREPDAHLSCVVGIGSQAWDRLFPTQPRPAHLRPFQPLQGAVHAAPATPGDLLLHIRSARIDLCFELAMQLSERLGSATRPEIEVHGFRYLDARSMLGFVDGTENPHGQEAVDATLVGDEDPHFAGGSYVITQKYLHDMKAWNALPVTEQEKAIGRSKYDDIEMADDVKPANAHNALTVIEDDDGNQLDILRANLPFGSPSEGEYGTFFIGYARNPAVTEQMLSNMFIGKPPGNHDRLLDFSKAVTGNAFFVPSASLLDTLVGAD